MSKFIYQHLVLLTVDSYVILFILFSSFSSFSSFRPVLDIRLIVEIGIMREVIGKKRKTQVQSEQTFKKNGGDCQTCSFQ